MMRFQYPKYAYGQYCWLNPIQTGVYILIEGKNEVPRDIRNSKGP